jgi:hypothetical protein
MSPLQQKINLVQDYILATKGKKVRIIFKEQDNTRELEMLEQAYKYAFNYFYN